MKTVLIILAFLISSAVVAQPLGLVPYRKANLWGYASLDGKVVITPTFDEAHYFSGDGIARVKQNGLFGFINAKGTFTITPAFTNAGDFYLGIARVATNKESYCINLNGEKDECEPPQENDDATDENEEAHQPFNLINLNGKTQVILVSGDTIADVFERVDVVKKYAFPRESYFIYVYKNNLIGAYNENGILMAPVKYKQLEIFDVNSYKAVEKQLWGVVSADQNVILPFQFEAIEKVSDIDFADDRVKRNEYYIVKKNGKYGVVNHTNKTIVKVAYEEITSPKKCSCATEFVVKENGLYGVYDAKGKLIAPVKYQYIEPFGAGNITSVKTKDNKTGYINRNGLEYFSE